MKIEIFSDVVCPWCYIGKKRLDMVLSSSVGEGVDVRWRPYQLYPRMPVEGLDRAAFLEASYGDRADRSKIPERIRIEAEDVGLDLDFGAIEKMPNTLQAHRLLSYAESTGTQHELAEVLFEYYFCEGKDVGDVEVLVDAGESVGMDASRVRTYLRSEADVESLREQFARATELGVSGVPYYLLAGRFGIPGAQTPDVIGQFIERAKERL
ncbi:MAG: DsbA family oxidoreductase [Gammaproteobacteria bacterium]|nr:DsbA family oxidoreductase [Gammaproteobacteria bacterium]